jgi:Glycine transporter
VAHSCGSKFKMARRHPGIAMTVVCYRFVSVIKGQRICRTLSWILGPVVTFAIQMNAQYACTSVVRSVDGVQIDIAPPSRLVDVCAEDKALCRLLTAGYPPTTFTLAYLVLPTEWSEYQNNRAKPPHFTRYLIAQHAGSLSPEGLPRLKEYLRSNGGQIPDHTQLPALLASQGRVTLGITDESPDSISFGVVMRTNAPDNPSAVSGAGKALAFHAGPVAATLLGMLTGIGGGMVRDVLVNEIPTVLRTELYAVAALIGAATFVIGRMLHLPSGAAATAGAVLCFGLRFMAMRFGWHLPIAHPLGKSPTRATN